MVKNISDSLVETSDGRVNIWGGSQGATGGTGMTRREVVGKKAEGRIWGVTRVGLGKRARKGRRGATDGGWGGGGIMGKEERRRRWGRRREEGRGDGRGRHRLGREDCGRR